LQNFIFAESFKITPNRNFKLLNVIPGQNTPLTQQPLPPATENLPLAAIIISLGKMGPLSEIFLPPRSRGGELGVKFSAAGPN
jgi:hypothetical protein